MEPSSSTGDNVIMACSGSYSSSQFNSPNQMAEYFGQFKIRAAICVNMIFEDENEARECYASYAKRGGFSIRLNHTVLSKVDRQRISVDFVCNREGKRQTNSKKSAKSGATVDETRIGCGAMMRVRKTEGGKWEVIKFVSEHNHELLSPNSAKLIRGNREVSKAQRNLIDFLDAAGISTNKIACAIKMEGRGECVSTCVTKDIQNYLSNKRRKLVKDGDAQRMLNFFLECKTRDPLFVFEIEMDDEGRMGNCFWADGRSVKAYKYFGDAVTFDATYLTNCYSMPFVPFTGVNHHRQSIMFGCALLVNETAKSYVWLLETWLRAMGGRAPVTIITDDDKAMAKAIADVLSSTKHHLCIWHILQKVPEHLANVVHKFPSFKEEFNHCIHRTSSVQEFEAEWSGIVSKYGLECHSWLSDLYCRREKWVPAYVRPNFCAGMSTTQRSESMNKFFKDYVRSSTTVSDFVYQYAKALHAQCSKEKHQDVKTRTSRPSMKTCYHMEVLAAEVYTRKVFKIFQQELFGSQKYKVVKVSERGADKVYKVAPHGSDGGSFMVEWSTYTKIGKCVCHMMEYVGIACRHVLAILVKKSIVDELPEYYLLSRWKACKRNDYDETLNERLHYIDCDPSCVVRRNSLYAMFVNVANEGEKSEGNFKYLMGILQDALLHLQRVEDVECRAELNESNINKESVDCVNRIEGGQLLHGGEHLVLSSEQVLLDPHRVKSKGRPKSLRQKNPKEAKIGKQLRGVRGKKISRIRSNER